ncbi:carD-like/TRCF domain protein [Mycobacterium xenopi 3993]|nr:carD-like/TRCF domain protein [Mycobacterium xenopi 3993]
MLRAHVSTGGCAAVVAPGTGTAQRVVERLTESDTPATLLESGATPKPGVVGVLKGPLHDGVVVPGANLVVITETDLTGNRVNATDGKRLAAKRRNVVDPLALTPGDLVVHDQHGIGRFVEMTERTVGGHDANIWCWSTRRVGGPKRHRQALRADGLAGSAVALRRWASSGFKQARRQRLGQHQDQGAPRGA